MADLSHVHYEDKNGPLNSQTYFELFAAVANWRTMELGRYIFQPKHGNSSTSTSAANNRMKRRHNIGNINNTATVAKAVLTGKGNC